MVQETTTNLKVIRRQDKRLQVRVSIERERFYWPQIGALLDLDLGELLCVDERRQRMGTKRIDLVWARDDEALKKAASRQAVAQIKEADKVRCIVQVKLFYYRAVEYRVREVFARHVVYVKLERSEACERLAMWREVESRVRETDLKIEHVVRINTSYWWSPIIWELIA